VSGDGFEPSLTPIGADAPKPPRGLERLHVVMAAHKEDLGRLGLAERRCCDVCGGRGGEPVNRESLTPHPADGRERAGPC
jgi:hypothetical protein